MKESRKAATDGGDSTMTEMRERYERAVEADRDNRQLALDDVRFVTVPGNQWDEAQKKARKRRPCYEFPILRSHWRQVVNDQKKARPGIKVRAVEDGDAKGAELRQGLIRNIESMSNAERAYDHAFELMTAGGFGAFRVCTEYSQDDGWDQDIRVKRIADPLSSVWFDPDAKEADLRDGKYCFVEQVLTRDEFTAKYPKADAVDFEAAIRSKTHDWFREDDVRVAEYWRLVPITKTLLLLSDGRCVDKAELTPEMVQQLMAEGITVTKERKVDTTKVVMSIVSGVEEIDGPHDSVFNRIPVVACYANRHFIEGRWVWAGMVRFSRDPQKLINYNLTTAQEVLAKQTKATPVVTAKMLEGDGVKQMWDASNTTDMAYLPITADPMMPNGPQYLAAPPIHNAFASMAQMAMDMLKASDGIFDESQGAQTNATSGRAIIARQREGDTATFDYQDALGFAIQSAGEIILSALPKIYDTPRAVRVLGKDGAEDWVKLYEEVQNPETGQTETINDLSAGKYDVTVTTGPAYDTQRMEFIDALTQLSQGNEAIAAGVPDLIVGSMDFPKAEEAAERLKLLLPPQIQQAMAQKDQSPAVMQLQAQMQQMQQMAQEQMQGMQQEMQQLQAKASSKDDAMAREVNADRDRELAWYVAHTGRLAVLQKDAATAAQLDQAAAFELAQHLSDADGRDHATYTQQADQQHQAGMAQMGQEAAAMTQQADHQHQAGMA
ncbi:MAG: portal protein, partial [Burkholderiaceae bacterium]